MDIQEALSRKMSKSPQMEYLWEVALPELNKKGFHDSTGVASRNISDDVWDFIVSAFDISDDISHRISSIDLPSMNFSTETHYVQNLPQHAAGRREAEGFSIKIDEYVDGMTLNYFNTWRHIICNEDGTYNPPAVYKRDITFIRLDNKHKKLKVTTLVGCWPTSTSPVSYSYDSGGIVQFNINFSCDRIDEGEIEQRRIITYLNSLDGIRRRANSAIINTVSGWFGG